MTSLANAMSWFIGGTTSRWESRLKKRCEWKYSFISPSGAVHRESGEHQPASQPRHRERSDQEGLPADRAAGQKRAGREPELQTPSSAVETVHVPQQKGQQEECGACGVQVFILMPSSIWSVFISLNMLWDGFSRTFYPWFTVHGSFETFVPVFVLQSSTTPYYTFYYDTGFSDEEEIEEQVLRNTVNSEALMTAFHQHQPGTNGNRVRAESNSRSRRAGTLRELKIETECEGLQNIEAQRLIENGTQKHTGLNPWSPSPGVDTLPLEAETWNFILFENECFECSDVTTESCPFCLRIRTICWFSVSSLVYRDFFRFYECDYRILWTIENEIHTFPAVLRWETLIWSGFTVCQHSGEPLPVFTSEPL